MSKIQWFACPHINDPESQHTENWVTTTILRYVEPDLEGIRLCLCEICSSAVLGEITRKVIHQNAHNELRKQLKDIDE